MHHAAAITRAHAGTIFVKIETSSIGDPTWDIEVLQRELSGYVLQGGGAKYLLAVKNAAYIEAMKLWTLRKLIQEMLKEIFVS